MARRARAIHRGIWRGRVYQAALFVVLLSASAIVSSEAQTITTWGSSSLSGTFSSSSGLTGLSQTQGGVLSLNLESLYYSIDNGPVTSVGTASSVSLTSSPSHNPTVFTLTATYSLTDNSSLTWAIGLDGGSWAETMKFYNNSGGSANVSLFQYSDFVVGNAPGSQTVNINTSNPTLPAFTQSGGGYALTLNTINTEGATTEVQADNTGAPFGPFSTGSGTLDNTPLNDTGTVDFGVEFDATVGNGNSFQAGHTANDPITMVPEPASVALVASGMALLALVFRRRLVCASVRHA